MRSMKQWLSQILELADPRHARMLPMEGLRGLAVTLVFLQHYTAQGLILLRLDPVTTAIAMAVRTYGNLGVELFFILSGFLIYGTLVGRRQGFYRFMLRRLRRLYPAYLCVLALAVVLHLALQTGKIPGEPIAGAVYVLANLLFLPGLFPIQPIVQVFWSLSYEVFFYIAIGLITIGLGLDRRSARFRVRLICGSALIFTLAGLAIGISGEFGGFPIRALPFFAGMLLFEAERGRWASVPAKLALGAPVLVFLFTSVVILAPVPREWLHTIALTMLCSACFRGGNIAARAFTWTPLRWLGNMSYSYYLLHGAFTISVLKFICAFFPAVDPMLLFWSMLIPVYLLSIAVCLTLFALVERPISLRPRPMAAANLPV